MPDLMTHERRETETLTVYTVLRETDCEPSALLDVCRTLEQAVASVLKYANTSTLEPVPSDSDPGEHACWRDEYGSYYIITAWKV